MEVRSQYVEASMNQTTTLSTPQDQVDSLIQQVAVENGLELAEQLGVNSVGNTTVTVQAEEEQDELIARLARLKSL